MITQCHRLNNSGAKYRSGSRLFHYLQRCERKTDNKIELSLLTPLIAAHHPPPKRTANIRDIHQTLIQVPCLTAYTLCVGWLRVQVQNVLQLCMDL
ncbi:hypothetical protein AVEN_35721-1 [Araneus ventricosus]|uniref:Uncharacterized protein n=1 Tax=Araneus ventricosus TaxID=182803 RepID=A0A4Y2TLV8_ARAVE|nr:hypothetical protein AVEN_35721-1 [Araneus ventricosus]